MRDRTGLVIAAVLALGLLLMYLYCPREIPTGPGPLRGVGKLLGWHAGSTTVAPAHTPGAKPAQVLAATGTGTASWTPAGTIAPDSVVPVAVAVDITGDTGTAAVAIGADTVTVPLAISIRAPRPLRWRVWAEAAVDGPSVLPGGGLSWEPLRLWGCTAGPGVCGGRDWIAPVLRMSRPLHSTINAGAEIGWRLQRGPDEPHVGLSIGVAI